MTGGARHAFGVGVSILSLGFWREKTPSGTRLASGQKSPRNVLRYLRISCLNEQNTPTPTHTHTYIYIYTYTYINHIYTHEKIYVYVYTHVSIHTSHIYVRHTHTHVCIYILYHIPIHNISILIKHLIFFPLRVLWLEITNPYCGGCIRPVPKHGVFAVYV